LHVGFAMHPAGTVFGSTMAGNCLGVTPMKLSAWLLKPPTQRRQQQTQHHSRAEARVKFGLRPRANRPATPLVQNKISIRGVAGGSADAGKDSDADILERIRLLPEATEFEKRSFLRSCIGYQLWLEPKYTKSSTRSYVCSFMTLFRRDGRSFAAMAGKEYYAFVKSSMSNRCESNAVRHFATFYSERCTECGGTFEVDPKWGLQLYNPGARALPVVKSQPPGLAACQQKFSLAASSINKKADDADLAVMSGTVSIVDPISLCRIETPVRGRQCTHLQVFDLQPYIEFNHMVERSRCKLSKLWNCPVCGQHVKERDLVKVDAFVKVLEAVKGTPSLKHVETLPDGSLSLPGDVPAAAPAAQDQDSYSKNQALTHAPEAKADRDKKRQLSHEGDPASCGGLRRFLSSARIGNSSVHHSPASQEQPSKSSEKVAEVVAKNKGSAAGRKRGRQPQKNGEGEVVARQPAKEAANEFETNVQGDEDAMIMLTAGAKQHTVTPNPRRRGSRATQACDAPVAETQELKESDAGPDKKKRFVMLL